MPDLIAAIQAVEPVAWPLVLAFFFSAAMFPLGILLPCSSCCNCPFCDGDKLPDTLTVTIDGLTNTTFQGPPLATLGFESDFGSGAQGYVTATDGIPGPVTAAEVSWGGEGYARIARVAPTLTASAGSFGGSGAAFAVTTTEDIDDDGRPFWKIDEVTVTAGGTGYFDFDPVAFEAAAGDTTVVAGYGVLRVGRAAPTYSPLLFGGTGVDAEVTITWTEGTEWDGMPIWSATAVAITNGGSDYTVGDSFEIAGTGDTVSLTAGFLQVSSVSATGEITGLVITQEGGYYLSTGAAFRVEISDPGHYFRDDPTLPAEVAEVTVTVIQAGGPPTVAAEIEAIIDEDPQSETFGKITGLTITNGGDGYTPYETFDDVCCAQLNGTYTLGRRGLDWQNAGNQDEHCVFFGPVPNVDVSSPDLGCFWPIQIQYRPDGLPPLITLAPGTTCEKTFAFDMSVDCSNMDFTATAADGSTATVTPGGTYTPYDPTIVAGPCCDNTDPNGNPPEEVTATYEIYGPVGDPDTGQNVPQWGYNPPEDVVFLRTPCADAWTSPVGTLNIVPCSGQQYFDTEPCSQSCDGGCEQFWSKLSLVFPSTTGLRFHITSPRCDCSGEGCEPSGIFTIHHLWRNPTTGEEWFPPQARSGESPPAGFTELIWAERISF